MYSLPSLPSPSLPLLLCLSPPLFPSHNHLSFIPSCIPYPLFLPPLFLCSSLSSLLFIFPIYSFYPIPLSSFHSPPFLSLFPVMYFPLCPFHPCLPSSYLFSSLFTHSSSLFSPLSSFLSLSSLPLPFFLFIPSLPSVPFFHPSLPSLTLHSCSPFLSSSLPSSSL